MKAEVAVAGRDPDDSRVIEIVNAASEALTLDDLGHEALPRLARAVEAAETMLYGISDDGRPAKYAGTFQHVFDGYARKFMTRDPQQDALYRHNLPISTASRLVDIPRFRHTEVYTEVYATLGVEDVVYSRLSGESYAAPGMVALALFRRPDQPAWRPREEQFLARTLPALSAAARRAKRIAGVLRTRPIVEAMADASDPRPRCALDLGGQALWISSRAAILFGGGAPGPRIPEELARAAARLGTRAVAAQRPPESLVEKLCLRMPDRPPLRTQLHVAWDTGGTPFIHVAIEDFSVPSPAAAALGARAGLTPTETVVLSVLSLGLSNAEIARRLFVSTETVRSHVQRILGKLGVRSRVEAILEVRGAAPLPSARQDD
jgi:DNA-binding CsgD family transcriptional regulator